MALIRPSQDTCTFVSISIFMMFSLVGCDNVGGVVFDGCFALIKSADKFRLNF
jgi:hypothetical protein